MPSARSAIAERFSSPRTIRSRDGTCASLKPADAAANADLLVAPASTEKQANLLESSDFTLDEKWSPNLAGLSGASALRYFFTQRAWSEVTGTEVRVEVRGADAVKPPAPVADCGSR